MSKSFIIDDDRDVGKRFAEEVKEYLTDSIHKEKEKLSGFRFGQFEIADEEVFSRFSCELI